MACKWPLTLCEIAVEEAIRFKEKGMVSEVVVSFLFKWSFMAIDNLMLFFEPKECLRR